MEIEDRLRAAREAMVRHQIERRGVRDKRVLDAMLRIPRHAFLPPAQWNHAYADCPLPIGLGQTISQPYIVGAMTEILELDGSETVLEIGTGSGYQAAVLSLLAREVHTVERHAELADHAAHVLSELGLINVFVHVGDGSLGWPEAAPYQAILVTAAAPGIPDPLIGQLTEGGRLVIPVGDRTNQDLERWRKRQGKIYREHFFPVAFVPLRGRFGWQEEEAS
jgi:protein-L-isoaspartate(D-aspartate) O-methyltransferase